MANLASKLQDILEKAAKDFRLKAQGEIKTRQYKIASPSNDKTVNVMPTQIENALRIICPLDLNQFRADLIGHFEEVRGLIPLCSSPNAFRTAWGLRSELLNPWDANTIVEQGGQLVPQNKNSRIFECIPDYFLCVGVIAKDICEYLVGQEPFTSFTCHLFIYLFNIT